MNIPVGVYGDASDHIYICDEGNNRILIFNNGSTIASGASADNVLGQPDFTSSSANTTQSGLNTPYFISVSADNDLLIADYFNNRIIVQDPINVLPLKLINFTGSLQNNNEALLQWQTADEASVKDYELQYSTGAANYTTILTTIDAKNEATNNYSYLHSTPVKGNNYYRLKIINTDGSFSYSNISSINIDNDDITISPNPAVDNITIELPNTQKALINFYNATGSLVKTITTVDKLTNTDICNLPAGTYFVTVTEDNGKQISTTLIR
jgi:hypothetical protein